MTEERPLLLVPSVYVWPSVRVTCDEPWPLALFYPAPFLDREAARELAPPELVRGLRAAADPTRLRALRLIAERPRTTEELAPLVGLSESGLSKHLRVLLEAGLIGQRRDGWYVLYSVDSEAIAALPASLLEFVGGRLAGSDA